jgi:ATP-binding cassette subfamily B protein
MARDLTACAWPLSRLPDALAALAARIGITGDTSEPPAQSEDLDAWVTAVADCLNIEVEPATLPYSGLANCLRTAGPALLRVRAGFILLLNGKNRVLAPDLSVRRFKPQALAAALCEDLEFPIAAQVDALLETAGIAQRRRKKVRAAIVHERLESRQIGGCWLLRLPPGSDFRHQLHQAGVPQRLALLASAHLAQYLLFIGSWWVLGVAALQGRIDRGWLVLWILMLLTIIPLRMLATWLQGGVAIRAGGVLKQRLLAGALRLEPDEIRSEGAGQLLGRVLESQQVEALALSGGFLALVASIEIVLAMIVLIAGGSWAAPLLLIAWIGAMLAIAWRYIERNDVWTGARLGMTHELVEKMVGHRTRLAQERQENWHAGEDQALDRYIGMSQALDRAALFLAAAIPRGWLVLGVVALAPGFISGSASPAQLAVTVGGALLGYRALKRLTGGLWQLGGAAIAWKRTSLLFHAAARPEVRGLPAFAARSAENGDHQPILEAHDIVFRYRDRGEPVLRGCNLRIERGDRLLLEGPSGGGKSTLAAVVTGMRVPQSGLILLKGLDRQSLGSAGWRRSIVSAPQFHENHVLTGTFAFNLMMGSRWPPHPDDFRQMEILCRELGLGELLQRMPAGLLQCVGDTGWQLSHGERSRLYIARALLQNADLVVLDESFAALDPENLRRAVDCVLARTQSVMVIAHP